MVVLCAIIRNEAANLLEWIAFHRAVGVDHFVLLDNESTDATRYILRPLEAAAYITLVPWQTKHRYTDFEDESVGPQVPGYCLALDIVRSANVWDWIGFIDLDEFLVPTNGKSLQDCLESVSGAAAVGVSWHMFGSNGHVDRPSGMVMENYIRRGEVSFAANKHVKTVARVDKLVKPGIHIPLALTGPLLDMGGEPIDSRRDGIHGRVVSMPLRINHYFTKSLADWKAKRLLGRVSKSMTDGEHMRSLSMFTDYDRNEVEDLSAAQYLPLVKAEMVALEQEVIRRSGTAVYRRLQDLR